MLTAKGWSQNGKNKQRQANIFKVSKIEPPQFCFGRVGGSWIPKTNPICPYLEDYENMSSWCCHLVWYKLLEHKADTKKLGVFFNDVDVSLFWTCSHRSSAWTEVADASADAVAEASECCNPRMHMKSPFMYRRCEFSHIIFANHQHGSSWIMMNYWSSIHNALGTKLGLSLSLAILR